VVYAIVNMETREVVSREFELSEMDYFTKLYLEIRRAKHNADEFGIIDTDTEELIGIIKSMH
jgi:hypothetical protein